MSLTQTDLQDIRSILQDVVSPIQGEVTALGNDVREIYSMLKDITDNSTTSAAFQGKSHEEKILIINDYLLSVAKQAGITLPR